MRLAYDYGLTDDDRRDVDSIAADKAEAKVSLAKPQRREKSQKQCHFTSAAPFPNGRQTPVLAFPASFGFPDYADDPVIGSATKISNHDCMMPVQVFKQVEGFEHRAMPGAAVFESGGGRVQSVAQNGQRGVVLPDGEPGVAGSHDDLSASIRIYSDQKGTQVDGPLILSPVAPRLP